MNRSIAAYGRLLLLALALVVGVAVLSLCGESGEGICEHVCCSSHQRPRLLHRVTGVFRRICGQVASAAVDLASAARPAWSASLTLSTTPTPLGLSALRI